MRLRPDSSIDPATGELVDADGGKLSAFGRGFHRLWRGFFEMPELEGSAPAVADIDEARRQKELPAAVDDVSGLETSPAPDRREGQVVDMTARRMHRMAEEARAIADEEHAKAPSALNEDILEKPTGL